MELPWRNEGKHYLCAMKEIEEEIIRILTEEEVGFIRFTDITELPSEQNRGLPRAVSFGIPLTQAYVQKVKETPDYVETIIAQNQVGEDEFSLKELKAGGLADRIAELLTSEGYRAYSLSDNNVIATHAWDADNLRTLLPQKTVAVLAGAGWIGKNNLLITPAYGPAFTLGTVLTDAPLATVDTQPMECRCGACRICTDICPTGAIYGKAWEKYIPREERIDVHRCTTCLKCLVHCPYTGKYLKRRG